MAGTATSTQPTQYLARLHVRLHVKVLPYAISDLMLSCQHGTQQAIVPLSTSLEAEFFLHRPLDQLTSTSYCLFLRTIAPDQTDQLTCICHLVSHVEELGRYPVAALQESMYNSLLTRIVHVHRTIADNRKASENAVISLEQQRNRLKVELLQLQKAIQTNCQDPLFRQSYGGAIQPPIDPRRSVLRHQGQQLAFVANGE